MKLTLLNKIRRTKCRKLWAYLNLSLSLDIIFCPSNSWLNPIFKILLKNLFVLELIKNKKLINIFSPLNRTTTRHHILPHKQGGGVHILVSYLPILKLLCYCKCLSLYIFYILMSCWKNYFSIVSGSETNVNLIFNVTHKFIRKWDDLDLVTFFGTF